ncbi:MAG TPA: TetR/AcrR family transcriptional regulator, partial [Vicinamibacteria bacterium]|nr:TetR/AcrR family transcriptional regulator [Vicinamibacteria bacterium]
MSAPSRAARTERTREEILGSAAALFARDGYHGVGMRELARATGHGLANLYNYFSGKDELLFELQSRAFETLISTAGAALSVARSPEERLYAFAYNHVRYVTAHGDVMRVLVTEAGALPAGRRRAVRELKERYFGIGEEAVRRVMEEAGQAPSAGERERAAYTVFGMLNWVYAWHEADRHGSAEEVAATIHALAMGGLAARRPATAPVRETRRRVDALGLASPLRPV